MEMKQLNPSVKQGKTAAERKRIPMSVPVNQLEVEDIPGYHLHWFNSTPGRIQRALDGGYEFVDSKELNINNVALGGDSAVSGSTDMGSQVSIVSGTELDSRNQPLRLILMKIKLEYYLEDQKLLERRNDSIADALKGGLLGSDRPEGSMEAGLRYVKKDITQIPAMFTKKQ